MLKKLVTSALLLSSLNISTSSAALNCGENSCCETICSADQAYYGTIWPDRTNIVYTVLTVAGGIAYMGCKNTLYNPIYIGYNQRECGYVPLSSCIDEDDNTPDGSDTPPTIPGTPPPNVCTRSGSIIETASQVIGETIPLVGTPFFLTNFSSRSKGRTADYIAQIPLSGPTLSSRVSGFVIEISNEQNNLLHSTTVSAGVKKTNLMNGMV